MVDCIFFMVNDTPLVKIFLYDVEVIFVREASIYFGKIRMTEE